MPRRSASFQNRLFLWSWEVDLGSGLYRDTGPKLAPANPLFANVRINGALANTGLLWGDPAWMPHADQIYPAVFSAPRGLFIFRLQK
jgi:hypothetical protein